MMRPRWPRYLAVRPARGLTEENGPSATAGPRVERDRLPLFVAPNGGSNRFATLSGQLVLALPTAAITAFVVLWAVTTAWTPGPSHRTADGYSGPPQAALERGTPATKEQPISPRTRLAILRAPSGSSDDAIPLGVSLAGANGRASLLISGLPAGSTISSGRPMEAGNWRLPASELSNAAIHPPRGFVGAM